MKRIALLLMSILLVSLLKAATKDKAFEIIAQHPITLAVDPSEAKVVKTALELLARDCQTVFSSSLVSHATKGEIVVGTWGQSPLLKACNIDLSALRDKKQAFVLAVSPKGKLIVAGSDPLGTAYGILEISRLIGVSPWEWWADALPVQQKSFVLPADYRRFEFPNVEFRGIFINDEDWGLLPWSYKTFEPSEIKGHIGPRTHERIFELLLRLRANTYWPAMHEVSLPFFMTEGNREVADKYGIYIGTSHCEPMACNAAGEWKRRGIGEYDYVHNSSAVSRFWEERVKDVAGQNIIYTLGMRGVHDGQMQGAKTTDEQKTVLTKVMDDQRALLRKYIPKDVEKIPQVFIPYKEVLDVYHAGLKVPEDVCLMWCDDNYGYIHHFPTEQERARQGGNGVYYHISYWGRPHDYLWLSTASPALIFQQMKLAYETGAQKMWILNVGDIKPAEYQIELFMDMAWNMEEVKRSGVSGHLQRFLEREFGKELGAQLSPVMNEYYRLAFIRKPEFMGNTREEEKNPAYKIIKDLPWSERYIRNRLEGYQQLSDKVEALSAQVRAERRDEYFQLVKYPVQAACQMNHKILKAQLARHGKADWRESDAAFDRIMELSQRYNNKKWNHILSAQPRKLPVFERVKHDTASLPLPEDRLPAMLWNGAESSEGKPVVFDGLGYGGKAAGIAQGDSLVYRFQEWKKDSALLEIHLLPNFPVTGDQLRLEVSLDGGEPQIISYETHGRSEEWKENVLRNQAIRQLKLLVPHRPEHWVRIKALDKGVVVDQILLY